MTPDRPRVDLVAAPESAADLVLLAHGGQEHSMADPHDWRAPLLRMWPLARAARLAAPGAAVGLMRYRYRGWNGEHAHAATDLRSVLDRLPERIMRVALIGHSMGGRAVLRSGDHDRVCAILALAPWLPQADPLVELPDRLVVLAHGAQDRITDPALTSRYASALRASGTRVANLRAADETHALLRRHADWNALVHRFAGRSLGDDRSALSDLLGSDPSRAPDPLPHWSHSRGTTRAVASIAATRLRQPVVGHL
jgi:predicted esterase